MEGVELPTTQGQGHSGAGYRGRRDYSVGGHVDQQIWQPPSHPQVVDNRMENSAFLQSDNKDRPVLLILMG